MSFHTLSIAYVPGHSQIKTLPDLMGSVRQGQGENESEAVLIHMKNICLGGVDVKQKAPPGIPTRQGLLKKED